jgi:hypothetical protein
MSHSPEHERPTANTHPREAEQTSSHFWPPEHDLPANIDVDIIFHGLFLFARGENGSICEVGVHSDAPRHDFRVFVLKVEQNDAVVLPLPPGPYSNIVIDVVRPHDPGVRFFQPQGEESSAYSWSRVPDLEGPAFYDQKLEKVSRAIKPIIKIRHGVFYTYMITDYEFLREAEDNSTESVDLQQIAFLIGAALSHDGGSVTLTIDGQKLTLNADGESKHIIYFWNSCLEDDNPCVYEPHSSDAERRNDFHLYYRMVKAPKGKSRYLLRLKQNRERQDAAAKPAAPLAPISMNFINLNLLNKLRPFSTHEAPCGGAGTGRTTDGFGNS